MRGELLLSSRRVFVHQPQAPRHSGTSAPLPAHPHPRVTTGQARDEAEGSWPHSWRGFGPECEPTGWIWARGKGEDRDEKEGKGWLSVLLMDRQQIPLQINPGRCGVGIDFELVMIMHQEVIN